MTLAQLHAFLSAYDLGSFTAAGRKLGMSQASVSELVARLEREIGLSLFTRGSRKLVPTAAAGELRPHAMQAVAAVDSGVDAMRSLTSLQGGVSTFGVLRNAGYYGLADLVQQFHRRYPGVRVRMVGLNSNLVAECVVAGEIECGLVVLPVGDESLEVKPLFRDEVLYISSTRSLDAGPVTIQEFTGSELVLYDATLGSNDPTRKQLLARAEMEGLRIQANIEVEHVETAIDLVASGTGSSIASTALTQSANFPPGIRTFSFVEPLYDTIALVKRRDSFLSPATQKFAKLAERSLLRDASHS